MLFHLGLFVKFVFLMNDFQTAINTTIRRLMPRQVKGSMDADCAAECVELYKDRHFSPRPVTRFPSISTGSGQFTPLEVLFSREDGTEVHVRYVWLALDVQLFAFWSRS